MFCLGLISVSWLFWLVCLVGVMTWTCLDPPCVCLMGVLMWTRLDSDLSVLWVFWRGLVCLVGVLWMFWLGHVLTWTCLDSDLSVLWLFWLRLLLTRTCVCLVGVLTWTWTCGCFVSVLWGFCLWLVKGDLTRICLGVGHHLWQTRQVQMFV